MAAEGACYLLSIHPSRGLIDEKFQVTVQHLQPNSKVTVHALIHSEDDDLWEAFGHYTSDAKGGVNVSEDASVGGTYEGVEPMGLLWSLRPVPGSRTGLRFQKRDVCTPTEVTISVYAGHMTQGFKESGPLALAVAERWYVSPGVQRISVTENGVSGTLFLPPGPGPFPAVLDLWGKNADVMEYRSALLASHGYVSLTLQYIGLKTAEGKDRHVGKDYFEAAFTMLKQHPLVCAERIAMLGLSLGVTVSLGMAVYSSIIQPRCLVCINGTHVEPLRDLLADTFAELKKYEHNVRCDEEKRIIYRNLLLPIPDDPQRKVDMGEIQCPLLVIVGEDDQNWPTAESAEDMKGMMEKAGNSHLLTILSYPKAGHLIEPPYSPHCRESDYMAGEASVVVLWGGETVPHSHAQEDSWQKTLRFLETHLYGNNRT